MRIKIQQHIQSIKENIQCESLTFNRKKKKKHDIQSPIVMGVKFQGRYDVKKLQTNTKFSVAENGLFKTADALHDIAGTTVSVYIAAAT
jgi:hypothetical protein